MTRWKAVAVLLALTASLARAQPAQEPPASPRVGAAIRDSLLLLAVEHGVRIVG